MTAAFVLLLQSGEFCPVRPDQPARPELSIVRDGRAIYFCCESCTVKFEANLHEGFGPEPLPELPGPNVDDPALLGLDASGRPATED